MFRRRRSFPRTFLFAAFLLAVFSCILLIDLKLRNSFYSIAEVRAVQLATEAVHKSLQQQVEDGNLQYQDFIDIHKDTQGYVTLMQANTVRVNRFASSTTLVVQRTLEDLKWQSLSLPMGQILGVPVLANYGPRIKYNILPVGTVQVEVVDKFDSVGINQTRHSIFLSFNTKVRIVIPFKSGEAAIATQVPLAESIIVGNVPGTFVSLPGGILGSGLIK